jgi:hypothetical protein
MLRPHHFMSRQATARGSAGDDPVRGTRRAGWPREAPERLTLARGEATKVRNKFGVDS